MTTGNIGDRVRQARERRGLSLGDAARSTKLSISILRAIEKNDFASLPAGMYRKAYLRSVAAEVGLDPHQIAADYQTEYEAPVVDGPPETTEPIRIPETWAERLQSFRPRAFLTLAAFAALAVAWFALQPGPVPMPLAPELPVQSRVRAVPVDAGRAVSMPVVWPAAPRLAAAMVSPDAPVRIALTTTRSCWVAAESDGERVVYELVAPGKRLELQGERRISLRLGDAGSVQLSINDGPSQTAGPDGEVVELDFTAGAVQVPADAIDVES